MSYRTNQNADIRTESPDVLLVEDNPLDLDLMLRALKDINPQLSIQVARDGEEALQWLHELKPRAPLPKVILLDLKLPKIGGLDVLSAFRRHPVARTVPVVVLTSSSDQGDVTAAYQRHANSYIVKPVQFDQFMDVVSQINTYWNQINQSATTQP